MAIVTNFGTTSTIDSALRYGSNKSKLGDTITLNCSKDNAIRNFKFPYLMYNRENDKVKLNRFVLSFANDNNNKSELNQHDSSEYVRKFINNLSDHLNNDTSIISYEHLNTGHNHYHIYLNSLGIDGKKLKPKQSLLYLSRKINDRLAKEYHLKPIQSYRQHAKQQFTINNRFRFMKKHHWYEPYSYYDDARQRISRAIFMSHNLSEFKQSMIHQNLGVEDNFFKDTKTGSVDIQYRHKNWELEPSRLRKVRTRTLGSDFEKSRIKRAIVNPSYDKELMSRYREYASPKRSVQGGQLDKNERRQIKDRSRQISNKGSMRGVRFKDERINTIRAIEGKGRRIGGNSRKIANNSVRLKKQESNYRRNGPQVKKTPRVSSSNSSLTPNLNGLSQREREEVIEDEKFLNALSNLLDGLLSSFQSIVPETENKPYHEHHEGFLGKFFDREVQIKRNHDKQQTHAQNKPTEDKKAYKDHRITRDEFIRKYRAQEKENKRKQAREHEDELRRQQFNDKKGNSISPNEQRNRYNKEHPHRSNHMDLR